MPNELSRVSPTARSSGAQKLGQPVRLSNLVVEENKSSSQPAQAKVPERSSCSKGLLKGDSVPLCRNTAYWSRVSRRRQSASAWVTANVSSACVLAAHHGESDTAPRPNAPAVKRKRLVGMVLILNCDICPLGFGEITWVALFNCRNSECEEDVISSPGLESHAHTG